MLLLVLCGYRANAQTQLPHARAIIFEVAPDPHEGALLQHWRGLSVAQRHEISIAVAHRTVPVVLRHLRGSGVLVEQIGSYLDETNPSFALQLEKGDPLKVAGLLACTLAQHSVLVLATQPFAGSRYYDAFKIAVGQHSLEQIDALYRRLRQNIGVQLIDGQTTSDGTMTILLPPGTDANRSAALLKITLGDAYDVQAVERHAAWVGPVEGYDLASSGSLSESVVPNCDSFKAQATTELIQSLNLSIRRKNDEKHVIGPVGLRRSLGLCGP
ncbi:MAG: hypothetical protein AB7E59_14060 [Pusillimonas sp.]